MSNSIISLIANSGIQFVSTKIRLSSDSDALKGSNTYAEIVSVDERGNKEYSFEFPYYYAEKDKYIVRQAINPDAIDAESKKIIEEKIRPEFIKEIKEEEIYSIKPVESLETFEAVWLPIPYFRKGTFDDDVQQGPETWARMWYSKIPASELKNDGYTHNLVIAFDTKCEDFQNPNINKDRYFIPNTRDANGSVFVCPKDDTINYNFCAHEWVLDWLETEFKARQKALNLKKQEFFFYHIGLYLQLLNILNKADAFIPVSLHTNVGDDKKSIEVDLVLDIGNSRTCGLLFESTKINQAFTFADAVPLEIRDLTYPNKTYSDPFEMRLAFVKANFGLNSAYLKSINPDGFKWPSLVRIGKEAQRLIVINDDISANFTMSSPKRYLWDGDKSEFQWEFIPDKGVLQNTLSNYAKMAGINEHFTEEGVLFTKAEREAIAKGLEMPSKMPDPYFSRRSLMTFVMMELMLHSITYINSYNFRKNKGLEYVPRKLKRIVITSPTAMSEMEKFYLRDLAIEALISLKQFFGDAFIESIKIETLEEIEADAKTDEDDEKGLRIVPLAKDMLRSSDRKKDWGYDEATCSQLAFIYGEIMHRYKGNSKLYFKTVGKKRQGSTKPDVPSVTIASVDIGGGTTDLMICNYIPDPSADISVLTPDPLFWEGFNLAGDDFLRRIIERVVLPVIAETAKAQGCKDTVSIMRILFGPDMGITNAEDRKMRRQFANQIALPIAYGIIQHIAEERDDEKRSFDYFFIDHPRPNQNLIHYINATFNEKGKTNNFDISKLEWSINTEAVNKVVKDVVEEMIADLCKVLAQYNCDFILLSGRPTTLPVIRELFLKYLPVSPDRIVSMGNFRIGTWYPFADATGRIKDPKTCVSVGATIGLMAGKLNRIDGFRIDTTLLRNKVLSTAEYIGKFDPQKSKISHIYFTPQRDTYTIQYDGPMLIGMKQLENENWPAAPLYKLTYSSYAAAEQLSNRLPLKIELERDEISKEKIKKIRSVSDKNDQSVSPKDLTLKLQTLADEYGYWMDTGSFNLPIF